MENAKNIKFGREKKTSEFEERVVEISRVSRVVKGGRRIRFRVLVVIGNQKGRIGFGIAKANEIAVAIKKAVNHAQKHLIDVPIIADTIPYQVTEEYGSAEVLLKPASAGTSIVAGGVVRVVAELAGIKNLVSKIIGTANKVNNVRAIFAALSSFDPEKVESVRRWKEKKLAAKPPTDPAAAVEVLMEKVEKKTAKPERIKSKLIAKK